jgi:N6-L-threonylcarbamoyladenine synthase
MRMAPDIPFAQFNSKDNAVMIAWAAMHRFLAFDHDVYEIETRPKWDIQDLI